MPTLGAESGGHQVMRGLVVRDHVDLGDVPFADVEEWRLRWLGSNAHNRQLDTLP